MAKTYRTIQQLNRWFNDTPGLHALDYEQEFFSQLFTEYTGNQVLLIGTSNQEKIFQGITIPNRLLLGPLLSHHDYKNSRAIESELNDLPIASGSVDLVVLPHTLESLDNPRQLLTEACRIVRPQGHIIICGFNPCSLWGIKRFLACSSQPWPGSYISRNKIKSWLALADFELVKQTGILFRPPLKTPTWFQRLNFMEKIGPRMFPGLCGVYVLIAQAKVIPLTPIKLSWKQKLSDVRIAPIGIPRPTIRNPTL